MLKPKYIQCEVTYSTLKHDIRFNKIGITLVNKAHKQTIKLEYKQISAVVTGKLH